MPAIQDWNGRRIEVCVSKRGRIAVCDFSDNLIRGGITPWPTSEVVQKLVGSRHQQHFSDQSISRCLGYYSNLQSLNAEDPFTWNVFGVARYASPEVRVRFVRDLVNLLEIPSANGISHAHIWLWSRIPHPEKFGQGGPELDFGILTDDTLIIGEAKWSSREGKAQGRMKDKTQIQLRLEFCRNLGRSLFPSVARFCVVGVTVGRPELVRRSDETMDGRKTLHGRNVTWDQLCELESHPHNAELKRYLQWRKNHSHPRGVQPPPGHDFVVFDIPRFL